MGAVRLIPLEVGRIDADLDELLGLPGRRLLPVPSWLVEHPRGVVLFDTGLHPELRTSLDRLRGLMQTSTIEMPDGADLTGRLAAAGFRPEDVDLAIFSHLHFDHCGGTAELPNARLVAQGVEWEAAHHPRLVEAGVYNPDDFDLGHDRHLVEGEHDVFGDGRVVCLPTPGHTKGHQALRVELDSGPVVLTGDCVYFAAMLEEMRVPRLTYNAELQLESMAALARLRDDGCRLLFGHDLAQFGALPTDGLT
ncbi:MAG TPA: N-acyl homoserine lactonase family protein [Acidimicrobiales bacterium]|nr:N-acyl homoserine lactonase family protein [Acidimicrobiales bacterium]